MASIGRWWSVRRARALERSGDSLAAERILEERLHAHPREDEVWGVLVGIVARTDDLPASVDIARRWFEVTGSIQSFRAYGHSLMAAGEWETLRTFLSDPRMVNVDEPEGLILRCELARHDRAIHRELVRSVDERIAESRDPHILFHLGVVLAQSGFEKEAKARLWAAAQLGRGLLCVLAYGALEVL